MMKKSSSQTRLPSVYSPVKMAGGDLCGDILLPDASKMALLSDGSLIVNLSNRRGWGKHLKVIKSSQKSNV